MSDVISIAIGKWDAQRKVKAYRWLRNLYGPSHYETWYLDVQPMIEDLVMRKDIYFMFTAAFGEVYGSTS